MEEILNMQDTPQDEQVTDKVENAEEESKYELSDSATKRYSQRLNKDRAKIRQEYDEVLAQYKDAENTLKEMGYEGANITELLESVKAHPDRKASTDELSDNPIIYKALEIAMMNKRAQDLAKIKEAYPECTAEDSRDIGEIFVKIMQTGQIDAVSAYEAQMAYNKRNRTESVSSMGAVKATQSSYEKDYYTPEEASKFTRSDYDKNPGLWEKVRGSMLKW